MNVAEMQSQAVTTEYNEWSNRETWIVNLWMTGDQGYYGQLCEMLSSHDSLDDQAEALEDLIRFVKLPFFRTPSLGTLAV